MILSHLPDGWRRENTALLDMLAVCAATAMGALPVLAVCFLICLFASSGSN